MGASANPLMIVYDAKPYDREYLSAATGVERLNPRFNTFRLEPETAPTAQGAKAVCVFVNDDVGCGTLEILSQLDVRMVALRCAGFNNVDLKAARRMGIAVSRVPSYSPHAVAEHTVALILTLNRKTHRAFNRVREFDFSLNGLVGFDLYGKTAGIIGTGKIGRLVCNILRGFGMRVLAFDINADKEWALQNQIEYTDIATLARESNIISLHAPLTAESDHLICAEFIAMMKPDAMLINVSRGRLVHTAAIIQALKNGRIGGVALDVYEEEEGVFFENLSGLVLQDDELARLLTFPNVLVTSHQAFLTREALGEISRVTIENINRYIQGEQLLEGTRL